MPPSHVVDHALTCLPSVGLAELDDQAALLTRVDRKYIVPAGDLVLLVAGLDARVLEIEGRRQFDYASTYYDTPDLASYRGAAHQRRRRFKVRTREYVDTGQRWIEVKTRGARGSTVKTRSLLDPGGEGWLGAQARGFVASAFDRGGIEDVDAALLEPVLDTSFRRSTLLLPAQSGGHGQHPAGATRATVDSLLCWRSPDGQHLMTGPVLVVETKAPPGTPSRLDRRLWALGHRPTRISKFCVGMSLVTPGLPANRWHRARARLEVKAVAGRRMSDGAIPTLVDAAHQVEATFLTCSAISC